MTIIALAFYFFGTLLKLGLGRMGRGWLWGFQRTVRRSQSPDSWEGCLATDPISSPIFFSSAAYCTLHLGLVFPHALVWTRIVTIHLMHSANRATGVPKADEPLLLPVCLSQITLVFRKDGKWLKVLPRCHYSPHDLGPYRSGSHLHLTWAGWGPPSYSQLLRECSV